MNKINVSSKRAKDSFNQSVNKKEENGKFHWSSWVTYWENKESIYIFKKSGEGGGG